MANKKPFVSVILPCYNHGKYVDDAIRSVLNQTYKDFELIIIENGSEDDSRERIKKYEGIADKIVYYDENRAFVYNLVADLCEGEWIAFMCADDYWEPEKLEKQMAEISRRDVGVCFTWGIFTSEDIWGEVINYVNVPNHASRYAWLRYFWENENCLLFPSAVIRKKCWIEISEDNGGFRQFADWYIWIRVLLEYEIYVVEEYLVRMRRHGTNESADTQENQHRRSNEGGYIIREMIERLGDEEFKRVFGDLMINPNAGTSEEIICEKILLLWRAAEKNMALQSEALHFYYQYFCGPPIIGTMRRCYGKERHEFDSGTSEMGIVSEFSKRSALMEKYRALERKYEFLKTIVTKGSVRREDFDESFLTLGDEVLNVLHPVMSYLSIEISDKGAERDIFVSCIEILEACKEIWEYIEWSGFGMTLTELEEKAEKWKRILMKETSGGTLETAKDEMRQLMKGFYDFMKRILE